MRLTLSLGSNSGNRRGNILAALRRLGATVIAASDIYETEPLSGHGARYMNCVAIAEHDDAATLDRWLKEIEREMGRDAAARERGEVPIDIDIVMIEGEVIRARDYGSDFFQRGLRQLPSDPKDCHGES